MRNVLLGLTVVMATGCVAGMNEPVASNGVYERENQVLKRADNDLGCRDGRVHVTTGDKGQSFRAEGCGRTAKYEVKCVADNSSKACDLVRTL